MVNIHAMSSFDAAAKTFAEFKAEMDKKGSCDTEACKGLVTKLKVQQRVDGCAVWNMKCGRCPPPLLSLLPLWHTTAFADPLALVPAPPYRS